MSSGLESEDLENVTLVRMEDVQPSRERVIDSQSSSKEDYEIYETCIIDDIDYQNEYIVDDDEDSHIGSMVSLQSGEVYEDDISNQELIIPEVLEEFKAENDHLEIFVDKDEESTDHTYLVDEIEVPIDSNERVLDVAYVEEAIESKKEQLEVARKLKTNPRCYTAPRSVKPVLETIEIEVPPNVVRTSEEIVIKPPSESWPTLEILPGGVIKNGDKHESRSDVYVDKIRETVANKGDMTYACAKCSQTFKYLFCLVKHVKWHEDQEKLRLNAPNIGTKNHPIQYICLHSGKKKILAAERTKRKTPKKLKS